VETVNFFKKIGK